MMRNNRVKAFIIIDKGVMQKQIMLVLIESEINSLKLI